MKKRKKAFVDSCYCVACGCCENKRTGPDTRLIPSVRTFYMLNFFLLLYRGKKSI